MAGGRVYGQFNSSQASGIGVVDLDTRRFEEIERFGTASAGTVWMAVELPWFVWTQANSSTNLADWTLYARNLETGKRIAVATAPKSADGSFLLGQPPLPVLRGGRVSWAQPLPKLGQTAQSEIHIFDLASLSDQTLVSGTLSSPVYAGPYLIWATRTPAGRYAFQAVGAEDLKPADLPARLKDPGTILYLAGSPTRLAWNAEGNLALTIWRFGTENLTEYNAPDIKHYFQFLQLAGDYVLWYGGITSTVMDLRTGNGFDVNGTVAGTSSAIAQSEPTQPASRGTFVSSRVSLLSLSDAPGISTCQKP